MIYVIGHKSPDLDSVAAAIAWANLENKINKTADYVPATAGDINKETAYVLEKFGFKVPEKLATAAGQKLYLVDHNEESQIVDGFQKAEIVGVLDHHKINFKCEKPIEFKNLPWGSACTIIAQQYYWKEEKIEKKLAGLMLAAILVDTVITKSPTCTEIDKEIIAKLAKISGIKDWRAFGMEIFKVRGAVADKSASEIIKGDFKDFDFKAGKFGIGQVETVDLNDFAAKEEAIMAELGKMQSTGGYHSVILFITDIIKEGSKFLVATSDAAGMEKALKNKLVDNKVYLPGIMSRKKQVVPMLGEVFDK
ncbi:MAG TPA: manganese-dependent inorganic pyrophosphatase [Candidatus Nanoarchaeia archaeon]|nr:manganese-dependent inorganic pyrophosphatase [Candidatus Nanoarchaeia archaeon]